MRPRFRPGRNLQRICDYISLRRLPWIREADRDFKAADGVGSDEPIITKIELTDWQPVRRRADAGVAAEEEIEEDEAVAA